MEEQKTIVLHGFTNDEAVAIMRAVKAALPSAKDTAFAMSTPTNLGWKLADLIEHVGEEHRQMTRMTRDAKGQGEAC
jgi:hypothetical protein